MIEEPKVSIIGITIKFSNFVQSFDPLEAERKIWLQNSEPRTICLEILR